MSSTAAEWAALTDGLPVHNTEIMSAHGGQPSIEEQSRRHGAPLPAVDHGDDEAAKYGTPSLAR